MPIDTHSVTAVGVVVTALIGGLLLHTWRHNRVPALLWWACANLLIAGGAAVPFLSDQAADGPIIEVANAAVLLGYGVFWGGLRIFDGGSKPLAWSMAGAVLWLVTSQFPGFDHDTAFRAGLVHLVCGTYTTAAALQVAAGRSEPLVSRNAAIFFLSIHAVIMAGRATEALLMPWHGEQFLSRGQLFAAFSLEHLLFTVAMAFILLAMMRERIEAHHRTNALTDLLTGSANRRAFFAEGKVLLGRSGAQTALVLFDLDDFKAVNDGFGHKAGDHALVAFARIAESELRAKDLFARIGGEEFACLLPGLSVQEGAAAADRIRASFAAEPVDLGGTRKALTVSAGVATAATCGVDLDAMLADADRALYEAKARGRNRVEHSRPTLLGDGTGQDEIPLARRGSVVRGWRKRA